MGEQGIPAHVGVIMDGNGRWAEARSLPRFAGHRQGLLALRGLVRSCIRHGVEILTVYAFSTENWKRTAKEVHALMGLMETGYKRDLKELNRQGVAVQMIGWRAGLPESTQRIWDATEQSKPDVVRLKLNVAFNYGGRREIVHMVQEIADLVQKKQLPIDSIDETTVDHHLYTRAVGKDPDLIIRTGGEVRVSNFLLWQAAYSEWYFTQTLWPDFGEDDFVQALDEYATRRRRYGGV